MATIEIENKKYRVIEDLGWQSSAGMYAKTVNVNGVDKMVVRGQGAKAWRFWTTTERIQPLREYLTKKKNRQYNTK